jgi:hypothetical protein
MLPMAGLTGSGEDDGLMNSPDTTQPVEYVSLADQETHKGLLYGNHAEWEIVAVVPHFIKGGLGGICR